MHLTETLKTWGLGVVLGILVSVLSSGKGDVVIASLHSISQIPQSQNLLFSIFFKNSLASLTIISLGSVLCVLELWIYRSVSSKTYDFFEYLSNPIYRVLSTFFPVFDGLRPFFRSCYFYLIFVPYLSMLVNGVVFGFLLGHYYSAGVVLGYLAGLLPHAIVEIPAMFASAVLALLILDRVESQIISGDVAELRDALKVAVKGSMQTAALIQIALLFAAFLEAGI